MKEGLRFVYEPFDSNRLLTRFLATYTGDETRALGSRR